MANAHTVLAAYWYPKGPTGQPELDICEITPATGERRIVFWSVAGKREARQMAKARAATPWNF